MKMKKARRLISILMLLTIMVSVPATSVHAESNVGRVGQSKVGSVVQAYTGGNSQVYAHLITRADGTKVRYVYSKNYLCFNSPENSLAALKSVLTAEFAALIPDQADEGVGFFFCSDPSLEQYVNENWTSAEYVARNFLTVPKEGTPYTYKCEGEGAGGAINTSETAARQNKDNWFERIKTLAEEGNYAKWEAIEEEKKAAWDAAEAEKKEADPTYIPLEYQASTYVPLDFGEMTGDDIQGKKDITDSQIDLAVGCNLTIDYHFEQGRLVELTNIEIIDHVASIYSDHAIISESSSDDEKEAQAATVKEDPKPKSVTYNGSAQELVTAGTAEGGEMQYALGTETEAAQPYTTSIPTATNAGTYYVWYKVTGDENHNDSDPTCIAVTIAHRIEEVAEVPATCEEDGVKKHYKDEEGTLYKDAEGKEVTTEEELKIPATDHDWNDSTYEWAKDNSTVTATRTCKNDASHVETETAKTTSKVTKDATETEEGETTYTATFKSPAFIEQTKTESIPKLEPEEEVTYSNTKGNGTQWTKGSTATADFTFKRSKNDSETFSHFAGIQVDGKDVAASNYTAESGSVIVKLKPSYLETLSVGEHTLTALFDDGNKASAKFTVVARKASGNSNTTNSTTKKANTVSTTGAPKTGDTSNMLLWFTILCASILVLFNVIIIRRRNVMGHRR